MSEWTFKYFQKEELLCELTSTISFSWLTMDMRIRMKDWEMFSDRFTKHQIFYSIILFFMIHMMNTFIMIKNPTNVLLNNISMLGIITLFGSIWMIWQKQNFISFSYNKTLTARKTTTFITTIKSFAFSMLRNKFFTTHLTFSYFFKICLFFLKLIRTFKSTSFLINRQKCLERVIAIWTDFIKKSNSHINILPQEILNVNRMVI